MQRVFRGSKTEGFQHEAVLYEGLNDLASTTVPFIREGLELQEPVLVAVLPDRIRTLRSALGSDADRVEFLDIGEFGGNPGRILPMWRGFVDRSLGSGSVRGIGEPVWSSRRDVEIEECHLHESLLNVAFDDGPPWRLMCPYDVDSLPAEIVADAMRTHPVVSAAGGPDIEYGGHHHAQARIASPLTPAPESAHRISFAHGDLSRLRGFVGTWALESGLSEDRAGDIVLAAHEIATNSIVHGGGSGELHVWSQPGAFVVELGDRGQISDPLVGRDPALDLDEGGRGVWLVHQLCDLVQVRSLPTGTVVRLFAWL